MNLSLWDSSMPFLIKGKQNGLGSKRRRERTVTNSFIKIINLYEDLNINLVVGIFFIVP
jgi:hypothetical protein